MFCIQCEQTMQAPGGKGCSFTQGMCGKSAQTSDQQDLLVATLQGLSAWALKARALNIVDADVDAFVPRTFFATLTNVNFDTQRIIGYTREAVSLREALAASCRAVDPSATVTLAQAAIEPAADLAGLAAQAEAWALDRDVFDVSEEVHGLRLLGLYGLKGAAAYMEHARVLGRVDTDIAKGFHEKMVALADPSDDIETLLALSLDIGQLNFRIMAMLDDGETAMFGHPVPTQVNVNPVAGKAILISGHDLKDLRALLEQTEGTGINVYTNGEMLPAHGYPELKRFKHLAGNYGSAWQNQQREFAAFPGPIIMTSNCLIDPNVGRYADRIYTRSIVGWPGVKHLEGEDFSAVIAQAQAMPGFAETAEAHEITVGFGRQTLLSAADAVIDLVASKQLRHVFLVGGCDGSRQERSYYADFARQVPQDCAVMTLACGKYRFNKHDFGTIGGLPRLLDVGQCNDAYSAVMLAVTLADKLGCGVNDLPLTLVLSWFEQKAIVILLTLLSLGVRDIYTGPTAPAFLNDTLMGVLADRFGMRSIGTVEQDMAAMLSA
ncbi:MAG: hydroxylamine reductase [Paludibacterium sp.]|uniref:hydroxylamine reductase n=1 Tax=Paludibacterium sp. TaxID=1917523 RepID=UPI0025FFBDB1|nr:hydroxylamine reductase [Paludibacterium sp.]MBV8049244.1 hydroxylamine reductase [Paludibacterium sp.]MBV8646688.1 hydroxylamine reductase [Paludibacterium sp.]